MPMLNCISCKTEINPLRLKALPNTKVCVKCSTTEQVGCVDITYHKTGNTIQVMDKESAAKINKLARRGNFGIMTGMKGGSGGASKSKVTGSVRVWRQPTEEDYQRALAKIGELIEIGSREKCFKYIENQYASKAISSTHTYNLRVIVDTLLPKPVAESTTCQEVIDDEILYAFRNWKNSKVYK